jgi:nucleoside-diphosphate-sugar epimerase
MDMRIFVTGASGWIGSAVVPELLNAGHEVVGLARSDDAEAMLEAAGAEVLRGDLDDLGSLRAGAENSDGVIHLAFKHDLASSPDGFAKAAASERQSMEAIGEALAGSASGHRVGNAGCARQGGDRERRGPRGRTRRPAWFKCTGGHRPG